MLDGRYHGLAPRYEREDQHERNEIRRRIDVQHVRRAEEGDEDAGQYGPEERRERGSALDCAVRLRHARLVLPDELRQDRPLRRRERRHEAAEQRDDPEQQAEAEDVRRIERNGGIDARIGARAKSAISIVVREPSRWTTVPLGMPRTAIGRISAARTRLIFPGEPVVTSTNHGSAR